MVAANLDEMASPRNLNSIGTLIIVKEGEIMELDFEDKCKPHVFVLKILSEAHLMLDRVLHKDGKPEELANKTLENIEEVTGINLE